MKVSYMKIVEFHSNYDLMHAGQTCYCLHHGASIYNSIIRIKNINKIFGCFAFALIKIDTFYLAFG